MLIETVVTNGSEGAQEDRLAAFLTMRGYRRQGGEYERGSWLGTLTALNPSKWRVQVSVLRPSQSETRLRFDVNTTGQTVIASERAYWQSEVDAAAAVLRGEEPAPAGQALAEARAGSRRALKIVVGSALALAIPAAVVEIFAASPGISTSLVGTAAGVVVALAVQKLKQDNPPPPR